jgi:hypothetical protein
LNLACFNRLSAAEAALSHAHLCVVALMPHCKQGVLTSFLIALAPNFLAQAGEKDVKTPFEQISNS